MKAGRFLVVFLTSELGPPHCANPNSLKSSAGRNGFAGTRCLSTVSLPFLLTLHYILQTMIKSLTFSLLISVSSLWGGVVRAQPQPGKLLKHVVMITFREGAPANEIKEVDDSFKHLANKLKMVKGYEWGTAVADEKSKGVTHVYVFTFASKGDLDSYGASPEHQQHIKIGTSVIERGQAVDYWTEK